MSFWRGSNRSRRSRRTDGLAILGATGAAITLAGVAWYWYRSWNAPSGPDPQGRSPTASTSSDTKASSLHRPTLSLVLPPSFSIVSPYGQAHILELYRALSPLYAVHLIHYCPNAESSDAPALQDFLYLLAEIDGADPRRVLAYSKREGAHAVARALGCDAHAEVLLDYDDAGHDEVDGTERQDASKPEQQVSHSDVLAVTQALNLIRRNGKCKLLVMLLLPGVHLPLASPKSEAASASGLELDLGDVGSEASANNGQSQDTHYPSIPSHQREQKRRGSRLSSNSQASESGSDVEGEDGTQVSTASTSVPVSPAYSAGALPGSGHSPNVVDSLLSCLLNSGGSGKEGIQSKQAGAGSGAALRIVDLRSSTAGVSKSTRPRSQSRSGSGNRAAQDRLPVDAFSTAMREAAKRLIDFRAAWR